MIRGVAAGLLGLALASSAAGQQRALPTGSVFAGADPAAMVEGGRVFLYPTSGRGRLHSWSSTDLRSWAEGPALVRLADIRWIPTRERRQLWAPHMTAANGRYYFYYSVGPQEPYPAKIGVAVCDTPAGPCRDSGRPLLDGADSDDFRAKRPGGCSDDMRPTGSGRYGFEAIDPMVFVDPRSGRRLLYAGGSNGSTLRVFELGPDMVTIARELPVDQPPCFTEGAWMHERGSVYYLSYSSGHWDRSDYSVRYATAPSPTGPWTYRGAILRSGGGYKGPGHHSFFADPRTGATVMAYHRWEGQAGDGPYRGVRRQVALAPVRYLADGTIEPVELGR
ncbi:family 43 glycosylhydrolase [Sphingomonas lenta]|uniref:Glycosyl hydrolase 43 family protein n=1 Tax=Sphingomonas lenta TaxID=1141887 RepID=A0A2A2SFV2_9SPHN|nr:family 43 glycosylhydrolase [Sphingomonas lenta]PAX08070.1 glycosyl hydrolase 43 family protein [Sphingomonas lenta]